MKTSAYFLAGLFFLPSLLAQEAPPAVPASADPFVRTETAESQAEKNLDAPAVTSICFETFSLPLADAAALYRQKLSDSALYVELTARVEKGQAKQEAFAVVRARSGEKALLESISETIYPTEYDHGNGPTVQQAPQVDQFKDGGIDPASVPPAPGPTATAGYVAPVLPISFETRNTGTTIEVEPTITKNNQFVDLRISPDLVTLVDRVKWGQGVSETELPIFESQRLATATTLIPGQPQLIGTPSKPPVSKVDADSANRVWFAFVTADVISVVKEK